MNPNELKNRLLNDLSQVVIFDKKGLILDSCHTLTNFKDLIGKNAFEVFLFLGSIQDSLDLLKPEAPSQSYVGVEMNAHGLDGYYDFEVRLHPFYEDQYVWLIIDQTQIYEYFKEIQSERNKLRMEMEYLLSGKLDRLQQ
jgi:hypothetical protein